jgi:hypothetical protein
MTEYVWTVTGMTESGDDFVFVYGHEPTDEELEAMFAVEMPDDWEAECIPGWKVEKERVR